jgi:hypothetical protein
MESDLQFYQHLDDLLARRDRALARVKDAGYPVKAWLGVRRPNPLGLRWVYYYVAGTSVRHLSRALLDRRGIPPEPSLLAGVAELRRYDQALESMLNDAKRAMQIARRLYAAIAQCARFYEMPSLRRILDDALPAGIPVDLAQPYRDWPEERRRLLPFTARQWAIQAITRVFSAMGRETTAYRAESIGETVYNKRNEKYHRKLRIILYVRTYGPKHKSSAEAKSYRPVMPPDAEWVFALRTADGKRFKKTRTLVARPRSDAEEGRRFVMSKRLSRTFLTRFHLQDHATHFHRMAQLLMAVRAARKAARPLFYFCQRRWPVDEPIACKTTRPAMQSERGNTEAPAAAPQCAAKPPEAVDSISLALARLKKQVRNRSAVVREITDE